jgi:hypothetical protein
MERKDYTEKFRDIKDEILDEIRSILEYGVKHNFKETFYVNYVKGEVFCSALEVNGQGMITFHVINDVGKKEKIDGEDVYTFDPESFLDILDHLKKDIREEKLAILREIVKKNGGSVDFDGTFNFIIHNNGDDYTCQLSGLRMTKSGELQIEDIYEGERYANIEKELPSHQLDKLIAYVENNTKKKFKIRAYETFSRIFEIEATNYDEAVEKICKELESFPFEEGDSDGLCFN